MSKGQNVNRWCVAVLRASWSKTRSFLCVTHSGSCLLQEIDATDDKPRLDLMTLLSRPSEFANETGALPIGEFQPMDKLDRNVVTADMPESSLKKAKVLVVGAGGLGCELLKNLALSGISDVHVIDLDTIDITNREFWHGSAPDSRHSTICD